MKNYLVIVPMAGRLEIDLLIPNVEKDSFTVYPLDRAGPSNHYTNLAAVLEDLRSKPDRFTIIPTSASTVDEVTSLHPELFI